MIHVSAVWRSQAEISPSRRCARLHFHSRERRPRVFIAAGIGTEGRLKELGIVLPALPKVGGNYLSAKTVGRMVYLAGVISTGSGSVITGTVGLDRTIEEGYAAARACVLTQLAMITIPASAAVAGLTFWIIRLAYPAA